jgi:hypothetical protein
LLREIKRAGLPLRVFYSARYAAITCARKMAALNKTRTPTPNATIELTVWPGPTSASDTRAAQASERSVRYLNRALAADAGFASTEAPPAAWLFAIRTVDLDQARGGCAAELGSTARRSPGPFPIYAQAKCADEYDAYSARAPSTTPAPRPAILTCRPPLA